MQISVLCSSPDHPVRPFLERWAAGKGAAVVTRVDELPGGDFLFLISCGEAVPADMRAKYRHSLVIHASDLPKERGWSPHVWAIVEGGNEIVVSLLAAADPVDSGAIWHQTRIALLGTETCDEINTALFDAELYLMDWALARCDEAVPTPQSGEPSYRRRRTPADSEVSPEQTLAEIFDLLRVADPDRFPVFFEHRGERYELTITRAERRRTNGVGERPVDEPAGESVQRIAT